MVLSGPVGSSRVGCTLIADVHRHPVLRSFNGAAHQGLASFSQRSKIYHLALVFSPKRAGYGQQIYRLQQSGLALGVGTEEHHKPWGKLQLQFDHVAEVGQAKMGQIGQWLQTFWGRCET